MNELPSPIDRSYLLVCPIPHIIDERGAVWLDRLWHHDLSAHLTYLHDFVLLSPRAPGPAPADWVRLAPPDGARFEVVATPPLDSFGQALRSLPRLALTLWKTIGRVDIVHSGVAGWPIAIGWVANPIALLRRRTLIIVVESAFWRIPEGQAAGWKARVRGAVTEWLGRFFVNRADLAWFTHPSYRSSLFTRGRGRAWVIPASWINEEDVLSVEDAARSWAEKSPQQELPNGKPQARILFAGRFVPEKGVAVLLAALRKLDAEGVPVRVDLIGTGPLRDACVEAQASFRCVQSSLLEPVPYGPGFFQLLRRYHAVVVPSVSDEQPRLVFDAYSQAVPVLASRTDGLATHVADDRTGWLFPPGDADALADVLRGAGNDLTKLQRWGAGGLAAVREQTHRKMHLTRWKILAEYLETS